MDGRSTLVAILFLLHSFAYAETDSLAPAAEVGDELETTISTDIEKPDAQDNPTIEAEAVPDIATETDVVAETEVATETDVVAETEVATETEVVIEAEAEAETARSISDDTKDSDLHKLIKLVESNDTHGAYLLGLEMQDKWEGDEEFDFNFGFAAAQTGHYNQAIFSFERLLQSYPSNLRFRLELARCHYFLKNYSAAEREFNQVKESQPPENVEQQIDKFLAQIAEQKQQINSSWQLGAGLAGGYDSNINAATDLDSVDATLFISNAKLTGTLNLDDEQKSQGSGYFQLQGYAQYQHPLSKRTSVDATVFASHKNNTINDAYDLTHTSIDGGFRILRSNHNFRFGGAYRHFLLDSETLQYQALANARWQWYFTPGWNFSSDIEGGKQDNDQNDGLDYHQWQSRSTVQRDILGLNQSLQFNFGSDSSIRRINQFQARDYYSFIYQLQKGLTDKQRLFSLINYRNNDYQDKFSSDHIFYADEKRSDQLVQLIVGWTYTFMKNTSTKLQINHSQNTSNLELYEYERTLIEAGLMISFN